MKRTIIVITILVAGVLASVRADEGGGSSGSKFFNLSLVPDVAIHNKDTRINGIALSIWGENPQSAFAWGFVNGSSGNSSGFSLGLMNYSQTYKGVEWGFVNYSSELFVGWQNGMVNVGKEVHGLQWGAFNYADSLKGVQVGLINIVNQNPWFKEFPDKLAKGFVFVNWSF